MTHVRHILIAAVLTAGGCTTGGYFGAKELIEPEVSPGRAALRMLGGSDKMLSNGRIDAHRAVAAEDGTTIDVWVIRAKPGTAAADKPPAQRETVVLLHPMVMSKSWFLSLGERLARSGYDVVLPDLRAHGDSGGQYITWGALERTDIKVVMDTLSGEGLVGQTVYVVGASLGGCVAIQYAAIDPRCRGVLAMAPPAGIEAVAHMLAPLSTQEELDSSITQAGSLGGFAPDEASALRAAASLTCPLIIVHGALDMVVPISQSREIFDAAKCPKKFITLPWADHTTVQVGRDSAIAKEIEMLKTMAAEQPATPAVPSTPAHKPPATPKPTPKPARPAVEDL
ncbi:MAG: alpha/beta fold hydrolase [Planctomycetaceae bacterium]|nr:alpha/beta fold hydrolase [Planctomycetaceae bacterium]